jgi:hypothetical protein
MSETKQTLTLTELIAREREFNQARLQNDDAKDAHKSALDSIISWKPRAGQESESDILKERLKEVSYDPSYTAEARDSAALKLIALHEKSFTKCERQFIDEPCHHSIEYDEVKVVGTFATDMSFPEKARIEAGFACVRVFSRQVIGSDFDGAELESIVDDSRYHADVRKFAFETYNDWVGRPKHLKTTNWPLGKREDWDDCYNPVKRLSRMLIKTDNASAELIKAMTDATVEYLKLEIAFDNQLATMVENQTGKPRVSSTDCAAISFLRVLTREINANPRYTGPKMPYFTEQVEHALAAYDSKRQKNSI